MSTLKICSIENNEDIKGNFKGLYFFNFFFIALFFIFTSFCNFNESFKNVNVFLSILSCYFSEKYFFFSFNQIK